MAFFSGVPRRAAARKALTHMTFTVGGQLYALPCDMVSQVARAGDISPIGDSDPAVVGQMLFHGGALIVVDMGIRLQGKPVEAENACVLIVKRDQSRSACLLDKPEGLVSIDPEDVTLSGCLVDKAQGAAGISPEDCAVPENTSVSGADHGFLMYEANGKTVLLPNREMFYPM